MLPVNYSRSHTERGDHTSSVHSWNLSFTCIQTRPCCLLPKLRMALEQYRWPCITPRLPEPFRWDGGSPWQRLIFWKNIFEPQKSVIKDIDCSEQHSRDNFPVRKDEDFLGLGKKKGHQRKKYKHKRYLFVFSKLELFPAVCLCQSYNVKFAETAIKETHETCFTPVGRKQH